MLINNFFQKFLILMNLFILTMSTLYLQDLLTIWFFMEINNFLFICYLCFQMTNKKSIFIFFLTQIISSLLLILPLIFNNFFLFINMKFFTINFFLSLMIKLGIPPFHLWMTLISNYMNWKIIMIFLTIQKIIPFYLISMIETKFLIFNYLIMSSIMISTYKMINLLNLKMLLTYSSINQTGWMLFLIYLKNLFWLIYMYTYMLILLIFFFFISFFKLNLKFYLNSNLTKNFNIMFLMLIMNLSSIPPMSFFLLKWMNIFISILNSNLHLIFMIMMISSFILIYIYINILTMTLFFYSMKFKFFYFPILSMNKNFFIMMLIFLNLFLSMIIILI
uniref:NADH-ubiquinone oxidoreductase chain 2 n=1 Tax=Acropyga fuhrmanni TaxID=602205 RepID=A0A6G5NIA5_9HYME|nr:NADH dehydrogenase subunit 2 [Acropyga fuhrmanni]QBG38600.1 NADH dehydrogenase subunit 2 [Acropyga fuhrmanni]